MYTVCWSDSKGDHWERCSSRSEVAALLQKYKLEDDDEVLIFPPDADDLVITSCDIFHPI